LSKEAKSKSKVYNLHSGWPVPLPIEKCSRAKHGGEAEQRECRKLAGTADAEPTEERVQAGGFEVNAGIEELLAAGAMEAGSTSAYIYCL
jgi:hypothetical protein